ncbi:MAG: serine/threonine protein kinase, partial [Alphaproteobacteria bacterium]|nr:serine/threonine protein kinase [Alphaproteobacteria bacterium]
MDVGEKLGKYEIRGVLGRGAMGVVYDGWDPLIQRRVAIKTIRLLHEDEDAEAAEGLARFRREAQAAGRLQHPNVVGVYDYGETGEFAYLVMEFVDGRSVKAALDAQERFPIPEVARVMRDLLDALQYSHEHGVVHRDIKPANMMLTPAGRVKVADFGVARIESSSMTQVGTVIGTPAYMSPEQLAGQTVDSRSDIYSAGVVLYQLLTGDRPYHGNNLTSIYHQAMNAEPVPPSKLAVTVPPAFDPVVARAMAKRPGERYATAAEFAGAIDAAATESPAEFGPEEGDATVVTRSVKPAAARPAPRPTAPAPAAARPRSSRTPMFVGAAALVLVLAGGGAWYLTRPTVPAAPQHAENTPPSTPQQPNRTPATPP